MQGLRLIWSSTQSQRDLGLQVPINFVTNPGVSLSAACFAGLTYEDDSSGDCLSNLLAVGFRRFDLDLYWDEHRLVWSFCPVSLSSTATTGVSSDLPSSSSSTIASLASDAVATTTLAAEQIEQANSVLVSSVSGTASPTSLGTTLPVVSVIPSSGNEPLLSIGPFSCTTTINLSTFTSQILDYIIKTQNTIEAHLLYVNINIHAAASASAPTSPAPSPTILPSPSDLIGAIFAANLSAYMYTPSNLMSERNDLNGSWYTVIERYRPIDDYYTTTKTSTGIVQTEDGWPSESYIEFSKSKRLILGWGAVDPQMASYNFSGDSSNIFPQNYVQNERLDVGLTAGALSNNCISDNANSSWSAVSNVSNFDFATMATSNLDPTLNLTTNLTDCGFSTILNFTLLDVTADKNYVPYQNYSYRYVRKNGCFLHQVKARRLMCLLCGFISYV